MMSYSAAGLGTIYYNTGRVYSQWLKVYCHTEALAVRRFRRPVA